MGFGGLFCIGWVLCASPAPSDGADAAVAATPAENPPNRFQPKPPPPELAASAEMATRVGREIFEQDEVSARATDLLLARVPDARTKRGAGWVTIGGPWWKVVFLTGAGEELRVMYEVNFPRGELPEASRPTLKAFDPPRPPEPDETLRWKALQTVLRTGPKGCGAPMNPVVLPASALGREGWAVYLLASTTQRDVQVIGGHRRYLVSADGSTVQQQLDLSQCRTLSMPPKKALSILTLVTPFFEVPHEGHVFVALSNHTEVILGTLNIHPSLWNIAADGTISYLGVLPPRSPDAGR